MAGGGPAGDRVRGRPGGGVPPAVADTVVRHTLPRRHTVVTTADPLEEAHQALVHRRRTGVGAEIDSVMSDSPRHVRPRPTHRLRIRRLDQPGGAQREVVEVAQHREHRDVDRREVRPPRRPVVVVAWVRQPLDEPRWRIVAERRLDGQRGDVVGDRAGAQLLPGQLSAPERDERQAQAAALVCPALIRVGAAHHRRHAAQRRRPPGGSYSCARPW